MKIYIDYIFLENLIINFIIIYSINILTKIKPKKINMVFSVLILSIYTTLSYIFVDSILTSIICKIMVVNIAVYIAYRPDTLKLYIKEQIYYYLVSFLLVGIVISITLFFNISLEKEYIKLVIYSFSAVLLYVFNKLMWKLWKSNIKNDDLIYTIKINGININAFVDTGNSVYDYVDNLDVIFIEKQYYSMLKARNILNEKVALKFNTISSANSVDGYIVSDLEMYKNSKKIIHFNKVVLAFVDRKLDKEDKYNAIIGYDTYVNKLKGVYLC